MIVTIHHLVNIRQTAVHLDVVQILWAAVRTAIVILEVAIHIQEAF